MVTRIAVWLFLSITAFPSSGFSKDRTNSTACSNASLTGTFGFLLSGVHVSMGDYALMGVFTVDGKGNLKGKGIQSANGQQAQVSFVGTYSVETDCTGSASFTFEDKQLGKVRFVLVSNATEVLIFDVGGHTVETGYAKKQFGPKGKK